MTLDTSVAQLTAQYGAEAYYATFAADFAVRSLHQPTNQPFYLLNISEF
eukprot:COSAG05_NODE_1198_length_5555_cov_3.672287_10_plen_49_part_00